MHWLRLWRSVALAGALALTGCQQGGVRADVALVLQFVRDGRPAAAETVYRLEQIRYGARITAVLVTDAEGRIAVTGSFCLPLRFETAGGGAVVTLSTQAVAPVVLQPARPDRLERYLGKPKPEYADWSARNAGCD